MRKLVFIFILFLAVSCVDKGEDPAGNGASDPLSQWVIPESVHAGGEGIVQWSGFAEGDRIYLVSASGTDYELTVKAVTGSGLICIVSPSVPSGKYMLVLDNGKRVDLGEVDVLPQVIPVTGIKVPAGATQGETVYISGLGFGPDCLIVLADGETEIRLHGAITYDGVSVVLPEDLPAGDYSVYLEQDGGRWQLASSFNVYEEMKVKTFCGVRYDAPYTGTARLLLEWMVDTSGPLTLTLSEYLVDGGETSLEAYDRYVCGEDGVFVLEHDGFESSNDIEMEYTRDSDGNVTSSDVLIYGKSVPTSFIWTYDQDGNLVEISSPTMAFRSMEYTDGDLTLFRQTSFAYSQESLLNNPYASDVVWGYMAMKETVDPFVYFPYLLGWYSPKSTRLPVSMSVPSYDGSGVDVYTLSYEFDDDGYVTRMSWKEGSASYSIEFVYQ